jgi:hypothetical protein
MRSFQIGFLLGLICILALGQAALDNATILKLVKAGIGEDTIVGMVNQQPGKYALAADDIIALKTGGASDKTIAAMIVRNGVSSLAAAPNATTNTTSPQPVAVAPISQGPLILHDATPIRLRLSRNLSSADTKLGDTVDFEVLDDLKVDDVMLVPRGGTAIATVTQAEHKKRMARGGKLDINIDYVRLIDGEKVALRAVKELKGGGHTGAMTGGIVATSIVFFPAAPFFLFMHGKDVTIPKGTEITAYVSGEIKLDRARFFGGASARPFTASTAYVEPASAIAPTAANGLLEVTFLSNPPNAVVFIGGMSIGRTPFTTKLPANMYKATFSADGYFSAVQEVTVAPGYPATVTATLTAQHRAAGR